MTCPCLKYAHTQKSNISRHLFRPSTRSFIYLFICKLAGDVQNPTTENDINTVSNAIMSAINSGNFKVSIRSPAGKVRKYNGVIN